MTTATHKLNDADIARNLNTMILSSYVCMQRDRKAAQTAPSSGEFLHHRDMAKIHRTRLRTLIDVRKWARRGY